MHRETVECDICGNDVEYTYNPRLGQFEGVDAQAKSLTYHVDTHHQVAFSREGSRGHYLIIAFIQDAHELLGEAIPTDVARSIEIYSAGSVLSDAPMPSDESLGDASQMLHDYGIELEDKLAGYVVHWDDGYVIWRV